MGPLTKSQKRRALDALGVERLRWLIRAFEFEGARRRDPLLDVLSDGRRIDFEVILGELKRDELKRCAAPLSSRTAGAKRTSSSPGSWVRMGDHDQSVTGLKSRRFRQQPRLP